MGSAEELAAQVLRRGSPLRIRARGGSMLPFLWDGDVVLVMPTGRTEVGVGDVICYETPPGRLFVHRVIEHTLDRLVAKGDALASVDLIEPGQVLGTVVAVERRGRVTRLDTRSGRWRSRAIVAVSPFMPVLLSFALRVRRVARTVLSG